MKNVPVIDNKKCIKCGLCVVYCPNGSMTMQKFPVINKDLCKSCLICLRECPVAAITEGER